MEVEQYICHACKAKTLGQRFCPGCGSLQKESKIQGVASATVPVKGAAAKGAKKGSPGVVVPPKSSSISKEELRSKWDELILLSVDEQAMAFLKAFVVEFSGKFEEVLELAEQFKSFGASPSLEQFAAHRFLETRKESRTASDLRATLNFLDAAHKSSDLNFVEYLLFHYKKAPAALFEDTGNQNAELIRKLEEAIENYRRVFREKKEREEKKEELAKKAAAGDLKAKSELKRMELQEGNAAAQSAADEALSIQKKLAAKRALANPEDDKKRLLEEEQKRLEEEKKQKEAEEKRKREASKKALAEKAKLWK